VLASLNIQTSRRIHESRQGAIVMELVEGADLAAPSPSTWLSTTPARSPQSRSRHDRASSIATLNGKHQGHAEGIVKLLDFVARQSPPTRVPPLRRQPHDVADLVFGDEQANMILGTAYMSPNRRAARQ